MDRHAGCFENPIRERRLSICVPTRKHDIVLVLHAMEGALLFNRAQREKAIQTFKTNPHVTVFLLSLRAGGVGLNLVEANHVFMMDLWYFLF